MIFSFLYAIQNVWTKACFIGNIALISFQLIAFSYEPDYLQTSVSSTTTKNI